MTPSEAAIFALLIGAFGGLIGSILHPVRRDPQVARERARLAAAALSTAVQPASLVPAGSLRVKHLHVIEGGLGAARAQA